MQSPWPVLRRVFRSSVWQEVEAPDSTTQRDQLTLPCYMTSKYGPACARCDEVEH